MTTTRNRDMVCHTCGGKGHFKRYCPNRKVMFINEDNEYETGDDVDPNGPDDDDYDTDGEDAYPSDARTIVVSQRAFNVLPSASTQRCNLFQTKALVGPDKACKVIIDGGSCRNLASKELCTKLKLKYLPHPHPYYIQWLSDNGEMKVNHMVRVEFEIGPYKDCIDFDVVPMTEFGDVFPEEVPAGLPPLRGIEHQIDLIPGASLPNRAPYRTNTEETKEIQKQVQALLDKGYIRISLSPCDVPVILVPKKDGMRRNQASHEGRGAAGPEDGREAGHGAGHEDIPWTREGGAGGMRERRRCCPGRCQIRPDRPCRRTIRSRPGQTGSCAGCARSKPAVALVPTGRYPVSPGASPGHHPVPGPV
ncbi:hypothetical protein QYE76_033263 [Lolium multiflorum]|uniref:CCHC-type domain-containing protein n=1 Tax=Lolium multiflorum TaxID=4521 RepID=A0AAD8VLY9_LOLMU|nr:hypothetical protein QYE76_033263 [Lolium multiflorum]